MKKQFLRGIDNRKKKYDFDNLKYIDAETANTERYLQSQDEGEEKEDLTEHKLPFLRWLINNVALKNDSVLIRLSEYVRKMIMITAGNALSDRFSRINDGFYELLENTERLSDFEEFKCRGIMVGRTNGRIKRPVTQFLEDMGH